VLRYYSILFAKKSTIHSFVAIKIILLIESARNSTIRVQCFARISKWNENSPKIRIEYYIEFHSFIPASTYMGDHTQKVPSLAPFSIPRFHEKPESCPGGFDPPPPHNTLKGPDERGLYSMEDIKKSAKMPGEYTFPGVSKVKKPSKFTPRK